MDDPFYKQIRLTIQPNVDFQNLPIHSIVAHIDYPKSDGKVSKDFTFKSLSDIGKFNCFIENNNWKYKYSYKVNFKNSSHVVEAPPIESESTNLIINVGDTGVLTVDLMPGDLDWGQLRAAQITMRYEPDGKVPIEQQFLMDKDRQNHRFQHIVFSAVNKPYKYKVKYLMKDGKEYQADWVQSQSSTLMINDVWDATKVVGVRARGNFDTDVESILVNVVYTDDQNKYTQSRSIELDRDNRSFEWKFPVINEMSGKLIYSGTIKYLNNSEETIAKTETTDNTIWVGPKVTGFIEVSIMPDLIDFDQVKLAKLTLQYRDPVNSVNVKRDFVFKPGQTDSGIFKVELKDKTKTAYQWQGMFFMVDGSVKKTALITSEELTLVPQLSDAV